MSVFLQICFVGIGGALGALTRFAISHSMNSLVKHPFPVGTLVANVTGCFLIGLLIGSGLDAKHHAARLGFGVGFIGALTTFSTFGAESIKHVNENQWGMAFGNIFANVICGLAAVMLGLWVGKRFT